MIIKIFKGKKIKVREINYNDLKRAKEFLDYINSFIEEKAKILINKKLTLEEERKWIEKALKEKRRKERIMLIAQEGKKIVGITSVTLKKGRQSHVGEFGISVRREYRGMGLGKFLMKEVLKLAKKRLKPKIIRLSVFANNKIAQSLYKKFGFKKIAKIPKQIHYKRKFVDEIVMIKEI